MFFLLLIQGTIFSNFFTIHINNREVQQKEMPFEKFKCKRLLSKGNNFYLLSLKNPKIIQ